MGHYLTLPVGIGLSFLTRFAIFYSSNVSSKQLPLIIYRGLYFNWFLLSSGSPVLRRCRNVAHGK